MMMMNIGDARFPNKCILGCELECAVWKDAPCVNECLKKCKIPPILDPNFQCTSACAVSNCKIFVSGNYI